MLIRSSIHFELTSALKNIIDLFDVIATQIHSNTRRIAVFTLYPMRLATFFLGQMRISNRLVCMMMIITGMIVYTLFPTILIYLMIFSSFVFRTFIILIFRILLTRSFGVSYQRLNNCGHSL
jgi:hypothetical protein